MCADAAVELRLVTATGTNRFQDFMRFAAVFATRNPGLWESFLKVDPGPGEVAVADRMEVRLWEEVHTDLTVLCTCYDFGKSSIIRAAALWLCVALERLRKGTRPIDKHAKTFFDRFISGRNASEAQKLPDWHEFVGKFALKHWKTAWSSPIERDYELQLAWETVEMAEWQKKRMEILRWPKTKKLSMKARAISGG